MQQSRLPATPFGQVRITESASSTPGCRCVTCRRRRRTLTLGRRCDTTVAAESLDRHATYIVTAFVAGAFPHRLSITAGLGDIGADTADSRRL